MQNMSYLQGLLSCGAITTVKEERRLCFWPDKLFEWPEKLASLSSLIDTAADTPLLFYKTVLTACCECYADEPSYRLAIDGLVTLYKQDEAFFNVSHFTGTGKYGLLFSVVLSELLNRPHLFIPPKGKAVLTEKGKTIVCETLQNAHLLMIDCCFEKCSDYLKKWIPKCLELQPDRLSAVALFDEQIGGSDRLVESGVYCNALIEAKNSLS